MKLNAHVPNSMHVKAMTQPWEHRLSGRDLGDLLAEVDSLGFHKCTLGEHFVIPAEHVALSGDWYFHTTVALGYIAGRTKSMRLGSSVSILPLQSPFVHAKAWSTLDWLSGGRAEAMFGVGWLAAEFDMLGVPFHKRGRMADEYLAAIRILWTQDVPSFEGEFVSFKDVGFAPRPVQSGGVPVWLGGDADAVLGRVAKFGDGWSPFRTPPERFAERIEYIRSQSAYDGRPLGIFFALEMLNVGASHEVLNDPRAPGSRDQQKILDQIGWLESLGVTETIVPLPPAIRDAEEYLDFQRWVSEYIAPHFQ